MSELVSVGQQHSINFTGFQISTDGIWGPETKGNAIRCVQVACNHDYGSGLDVDGEWGALSSAALSGHYVERGETQFLVTAVEILLMLRGYNPNGVECPGSFGDGLFAAVCQFQTDAGITVDGIAGVETICALMDVSMVSGGGSYSGSGSLFSDDGSWRQYDPNNLPNFSADEFKCQCGCGHDVCDELKCKAQALRDKLCQVYGCDMPMTITDGFRCPPYNAQEGGTSTSLHMEGKAFDFQVYRNGTYHMDAELINNVVACAHQVGLGVGTYYSTGFCHCQLANWDYSGD